MKVKPGMVTLIAWEGIVKPGYLHVYTCMTTNMLEIVSHMAKTAKHYVSSFIEGKQSNPYKHRQKMF